MNKYLLIMGLSMVWAGAIVAEAVRPAEYSIHTAGDWSASRFGGGVEIGRLHALETYLSPVTYAGTEIGVFIGQQLPMRCGDGAWRMQYGGRFAFGSLLNPRGNARKYEFEGSLNWGMNHGWRPVQGVTLYAGGTSGINAGAGYVPRNSNNPAAVRASVELRAVGGAEWRGKIRGFPIRVEERVSIPVASLLFSPQYGESYYEIYLGNHSDLVHLGWWGNIMGVRNDLSVTLPTHPWNVTLGYRLRLDRNRVCNLRTRLLTNAFTVTLSR